MSEEWRDIQGCEGLYQVSNQGRVRGLDRTVIDRNGKPHIVRGKVLKLTTTSFGHLTVGLTKHSQQTTFPIHRLVAQAFIGDVTRKVVHHKNEDPLDNFLENLDIVSFFFHNILHHTGKPLPCNQGALHQNAKLSEDDVLIIRELANEKVYPQCELSVMFSVGEGTISKIVSRKSWAYLK